jgi:tetratricopeptide (TPR) repeat protein
MPDRARIHFNLGLLYQFLQDLPAAEYSLRAALTLEPGNPDYQLALSDHYLKRGRYQDALPIAEQMLAAHPDNPVGRQMLEFIQSQLSAGTRK